MEYQGQHASQRMKIEKKKKIVRNNIIYWQYELQGSVAADHLFGVLVWYDLIMVADHLLEELVWNDLVMAAKESGEFLHGLVALWAFHGLRDPTRRHWEIEAAARTSNAAELEVVILEGHIKALDRHLVLPQVILNQCLQNCGTVTVDHNIRPIA